MGKSETPSCRFAFPLPVPAESIGTARGCGTWIRHDSCAMRKIDPSASRSGLSGQRRETDSNARTSLLSRSACNRLLLSILSAEMARNPTRPSVDRSGNPAHSGYSPALDLGTFRRCGFHSPYAGSVLTPPSLFPRSPAFSKERPSPLRDEFFRLISNVSE